MPWPSAQESLAPPASEVTEPSPSPGTRFAFKLFRELAAEAGPNVFFSPSSVMLCLKLVYELSSGETRRAMAKTLEIACLDPVDTKLAIDALKSPLGEWRG